MNYFFLIIQISPGFTLFPYTTLFRSEDVAEGELVVAHADRSDSGRDLGQRGRGREHGRAEQDARHSDVGGDPLAARSEEHTSELQSRPHLVCRPLLEKKN